MRRQVDYHLAHARAAASGAATGARASVSESAEGLARTLQRLHAGRHLSIDARVAAEHCVPRPARGSRRDARQPRSTTPASGRARTCRHRRAVSTAARSSSRSTTTARAGSVDARACAAARRARRRSGARLRPRPGHRPRSRGAVRRLDRARQRADRRPARALDAAWLLTRAAGCSRLAQISRRAPGLATHASAIQQRLPVDDDVDGGDGVRGDEAVDDEALAVVRNRRVGGTEQLRDLAPGRPAAALMA